MFEQQIQNKIKKDLMAMGCYVTKYNANGYGIRGHSDLIVGLFARGCKYPLILYIEVKNKTGKRSLIQQIWHDSMVENGFLSCLARSTEDVLDYLKEKGLEIVLHC